MKTNDYVKILKDPSSKKKLSPMNASGRVVKITDEGVYITNINMPFSGTLINKFFPFDCVEEY